LDSTVRQSISLRHTAQRMTINNNNRIRSGGVPLSDVSRTDTPSDLSSNQNLEEHE
jgi:hypothetical protein